jgi:hypothetical protein
LEAKAPDLFKDLSILAAPVAAVEPVAPAPAPAAPPPVAPAPVHFPAPVAAAPAPIPVAVEAVEDVVEEEVKEDKVEKKGVRFGVRAGYNINNFSIGYTEFDEEIKNGFGVGVGLALNVPIVSIISLNTGLELYWRELFSENISYYGYENFGPLSEIAISIPALLQFGNSFYFTTGIQLDFPVWSGDNAYNNFHFDENRSFVDVGFVLGLGYMFENFGFGFKYVYGLTGLFNDFGYNVNYGYNSYYDAYINYIDYKDKSWLGQYCFGVVYFF